jgi:hypothetical protein
MKLPLVLIVLFGILAAATIWWASLRIRRMELERMPVLIGEMMSSLGLTPRDAEDAGLERAVHAAGERCRNCDVATECRNWLAPELVPRPAPRCPNAPLFDAIRALRKPAPARAVPRDFGAY